MVYIDLSDVDSGDFGIIPVGNYNFIIEKCEEKETKSGNKMLVISFKIMSGDYANRIIFENLNIKNPSTKCVGYAKRKLKAICDAIDLKELHVPSDLEGKCLNANVVHYFDDYYNSNKARIQEFKNFNSGLNFSSKSFDEIMGNVNKNFNENEKINIPETKAVDDDVPF